MVMLLWIGMDFGNACVNGAVGHFQMDGVADIGIADRMKALPAVIKNGAVAACEDGEGTQSIELGGSCKEA